MYLTPVDSQNLKEHYDASDISSNKSVPRGDIQNPGYAQIIKCTEENGNIEENRRYSCINENSALNSSNKGVSAIASIASDDLGDGGDNSYWILEPNDPEIVSDAMAGIPVTQMESQQQQQDEQKKEEN